MRVKRVYHRNDPILGIAWPMRPPSDFSFSKCVMKAGMIWDEVERAGLAGRHGVWCTSSAAPACSTSSPSSRPIRATPGRPGMLAASCQSGSYLGRFVVVVDDDIDPTDLST